MIAVQVYEAFLRHESHLTLPMLFNKILCIQYYSNQLQSNGKCRKKICMQYLHHLSSGIETCTVDPSLQSIDPFMVESRPRKLAIEIKSQLSPIKHITRYNLCPYG